MWGTFVRRVLRPGQFFPSTFLKRSMVLTGLVGQGMFDEPGSVP